MFFKIDTFALSGINAVKVNVEVNISNGLPTFSIVGLPDKSINEAKDRVKASIINSGFKFPKKKIIINLAPADIRKEGPYYDLPIALSILSLSNQLKHDFLLFSCFITGKPRIIYRALGSNIVNTVPLSELFSAVMVPL